MISFKKLVELIYPICIMFSDNFGDDSATLIKRSLFLTGKTFYSANAASRNRKYSVTFVSIT